MSFFRRSNHKKLPSKNLAKNIVNSEKRNSKPSNPEKNHDKYLSRNDSSEQLKRRHANQLRSITARLLKEQIHASVSLDHSSLNGIKSKSRKNGKTIDSRFNSNTNRDHQKGRRAPLQTLKPWVESCHAQQSDSMTERTTLCSALEMLSFDNLCNGEIKCSSDEGAISDCWGVEDLKVVGHAPTPLDFSLVPREISFEKRNIYRSRSLLREEVVIKRHRSKFLKKLLHLKSGRGGGRSTKVSKVKVYVDPPKSNNSIGNSTVTWPSEFQRNSTI